MLFVQSKGIRVERLRLLILPIIFSTGLFACSNLKDTQSSGSSTTSAAGNYIEDKQVQSSSDPGLEAYQWFY
jgi:hypothetical protein